VVLQLYLHPSNKQANKPPPVRGLGLVVPPSHCAISWQQNQCK